MKKSIAKQFIQLINEANIEGIEAKQLRGYAGTSIVEVKGANFKETFYFDSWKEYDFETELNFLKKVAK